MTSFTKRGLFFMLNQGLTLTLAGMATVFSFLVLLVLVMSLSSRVILRFARDEEPVRSVSKRKNSDPEISVVIAAAAAAAKKKGKL